MSPCLDQGDARATVIHHMQRLALQRGGVGADWAAMLAEDLEAAEIDALFGEARRLLPRLAHALACSVIDIEGRATAALVDLAQLVLVVPVHVRPCTAAAQ